MKSLKSGLLALFIVLSGTLVGDEIIVNTLFYANSIWKIVNCQEPQDSYTFIYQTNPSAYISAYSNLENDYRRSPSNPNLWYIYINETFIIPGLDGWTHFFKGDGYNKRRYIAHLTVTYTYESDGSLVIDGYDYSKYVENNDVPCNHIFGD